MLKDPKRDLAGHFADEPLLCLFFSGMSCIKIVNMFYCSVRHLSIISFFYITR